MNTFIPLEKLADTDLTEFHEVWLTTEEIYPQDPCHAHSECLWRVNRTFTTHDEVDDQYFINLPKLWLRVDDLKNLQATDDVKQALQARLDEQQLTGEFYPSPLSKRKSEKDARDLRS